MKQHRFSSAEIEQKLNRARRLQSQSRPWSAFAELVPGVEMPEPGAPDFVADQASKRHLKALGDWPCDSYLDADEVFQARVLRFLLKHHDALGSLAGRKGWLMDWYRTLFTLAPPDSREAELAAKNVGSLRYSERTEQVFRLLFSEHQFNGEVAKAWLRHLWAAGRQTQIIKDATALADCQNDPSARREVLTWLAKAYLNRGLQTSHNDLDSEMAVGVLHRIWNAGLWVDEEHVELFDCAIDQATPQELKEGRGEATNIVGDAWRGMKRASKSLGKWFGGRDATIPYNQAVLDSCPRLLPPLQVEEYLDTNVRIKSDFRDIFQKAGELEAPMVVGVLGAGGLWTLSQIDHTVLEAITFSGAEAPSTFQQRQSIAESIQNTEGAAHAGHINRLQGYVAEQQVALDFAREGHDVRFPETPNQEGWDLIIDGTHVQVKNTLNANYVQEHLDAYPDIPVVVNTEMAEYFEGNDMVWVDAGLVHADVVSTTNESLEALDEFGGLDDLTSIPLVSVAFAAIRNFGDFDSGRIEASTYAKRVGVDVGFRTAGGGVGSIIGGAVGTVIGPVGTVIGTAIGGFIGNIAGGTGSDAVNRKELCDGRDRVVGELSDFAHWFSEKLLPPRIRELKTRSEWMEAWSRQTQKEGKLSPYTTLIYLASQEALQRANGLQTWMSKRVDGDDFARGHAGWAALDQASSFFHRDLRARVERIRVELSRYADVQKTEAPTVAGGEVPEPGRP